MLKVLILFFVNSFVFMAHGKRFANSYTEFELPPGWECAIEGSEWVCQSETKNLQKEAIIILAAKKRGNQDTLADYQKYLEQPKNYKLPGAKTQRSEPKTIRTTDINGHKWVDALHLASEVPGFYTRYLATVKADIGVAITFSVTKSMYNAYKGIFDNVIASMRIFRQANTNLAYKGKGKTSSDGFDDVGVFVDPELARLGDGAQVEKRKQKKNGNGDMIFIIIVAALALGVLLKLKQKNKKAAKDKESIS